MDFDGSIFATHIVALEPSKNSKTVQGRMLAKTDPQKSHVTVPLIKGIVWQHQYFKL